METLMNVLQWINDHVIEEYLAKGGVEAHLPLQRPFEPTKSLREKDAIIVAMLNSVGHEDVSFCVTDPDKKDNPIVFASDGFCHFTGYSAEEIEGKNCRFLQGPGTKKDQVQVIRDAIQNETEASVNLLNYRKDGSSFNNQFFIMPMYSDEDNHDASSKPKTLQYYIGIQCSVERLAPAQHPKNVGWIYTQGLHA